MGAFGRARDQNGVSHGRRLPLRLPDGSEPRDAQVTLLGVVFFSVPFGLPYLESSWLFPCSSAAIRTDRFRSVGFRRELWFYRSVIDASPRGLTVTGGLFGRAEPMDCRLRRPQDPAHQPFSDRRRTFGGGVLRLVVTCAQGTQSPLASGCGKPLALAVIHEIQQAMGKSIKDRQLMPRTSYKLARTYSWGRRT